MAGLYRIRRIGRDDLDCIGQTGMGTMTLRKRLGMLRGVYGDLMPYRDPHTAGPALWALYHQTGEDFEVSVVPVEGSTPWRKGLEALAIAQYRQHGCSPTVEFGRMPTGDRASSSYNRHLRKAGRPFHGSPSEVSDASHTPGVPPLASLTGDPHDAQWGGHRGSGLYRMRGRERGALLYIGYGLIAPRLLAHLAKTRVHDHAQGQLFAAAATSLMARTGRARKRSTEPFISNALRSQSSSTSEAAS